MGHHDRKFDRCCVSLLEGLGSRIEQLSEMLQISKLTVVLQLLSKFVPLGFESIVVPFTLGSQLSPLPAVSGEGRDENDKQGAYERKDRPRLIGLGRTSHRSTGDDEQYDGTSDVPAPRSVYKARLALHIPDIRA